MKIRTFLTYEPQDTWIHDLSGVTKFIFFIAWSVVCGLTYDTRVLAVMILISMSVLYMSKARWSQFSIVVKVLAIFMVLNIITIFLFSPYQGCLIYGSRTDICHLFGKYTLTKEHLFYSLNIMIKYFAIVPTAFMFMTSTAPNEFAASLNKIGLSYNIAYSISLALRYIPDLQGEFRRIRNAQEARGIEMSAKAKLMDRIKRMASIISPLLFTSMERIDVVSNAMELRGFGKKKKRTWYAAKPLKRNDWLVIAFTVVFAAAALIITYHDGNRFYNPFI